MVVVVLTGGIGSGKSAAAEFFRERGAAVIDLDDVAARAMQPGSQLLASVVRRFGEEVLSTDGSLDRGALASRCFADSQATLQLDQIVHPVVARDTRSLLAEMELLPSPPQVVIVEVPLLVEAPDFAELGDRVVAIAAPESIRNGEVGRAPARARSGPRFRAGRTG
jgi:dephospho-CoA kinase